ncbi:MULTISPECIES: hypothetical protein [unclassified Pseudonocardia]|uniref:hypothetical protein n=1 Tax=unclassified Pseudonocardia TaxID=2619320 RepID=UPI000960AADA|nr:MULTISPECIES: hypothetical protein [unclassified Pseudonocardia]MBN9100038.1 hypothetical protein [Pseudonocardia sp.]OJY39691.1 MAG: hypothetical protein BGP03_03315 [Pseudonocardia sp. 73-21]
MGGFDRPAEGAAPARPGLVVTAVLFVLGIVATTGAVFFLADQVVPGWACVVIVLVTGAALALAVRRWAARVA